jgi:hypothetical protein
VQLRHLGRFESTGAGGDNGTAKVWDRREISVSTYYDQSHYLHPHSYVRARRAINLGRCTHLGRARLSRELVTAGGYPILNHFGVNGSRAPGMGRPLAMMIVSGAFPSLTRPVLPEILPMSRLFLLSNIEGGIAPAPAGGLCRQRGLRHQAADHRRARVHRAGATHG